MTFKEFQVAKEKIMREQFDYFTGDAIEHAIRRNQFGQEKLRRIIALAQGVRNSKTISRQVGGWKRILRRLDAKCRQMQDLHQELKSNAITVAQPQMRIRGLGTFPFTSSENRKGSIA